MTRKSSRWLRPVRPSQPPAGSYVEVSSGHPSGELSPIWRRHVDRWMPVGWIADPVSWTTLVLLNGGVAPVRLIPAGEVAA